MTPKLLLVPLKKILVLSELDKQEDMHFTLRLELVGSLI